MPLNRKAKKTKTPTKKSAPKTKSAAKKTTPSKFNRKVTTKDPRSLNEKLSMREAAMLLAYMNFQTLPLSIPDIALYSDQNMTPARSASAESHFEKIMERAARPIVTYFEKKGLGRLLEKVAPPQNLAPEYDEDENQDEEEDDED